MTKLNENFLKLSRSYLFSTIGEKVALLRKKNPNASLLNLGVGDVALPLTQPIVESFKEAMDEMGQNIYGYGPCDGYLFLREKILESEYPDLNFTTNEIFISDGIVSDICNIQELFSSDTKVGIIDPTYPAYLETTLLSGKKIHFIPCLEENGFIPIPIDAPLDIIYLCSPNNPTGVAMTRSDLKKWIDYAKEHQAIILFDGAYEKFITSCDVPRSIYEIEGAKEVAIEFRSFSKSAGFTGLRLGYTVIPNELFIFSSNGKKQLNKLWRIRQDIKTNGVSYPIQKAGLASLSGIGKKAVDAQIAVYAYHAKKLKQCIESLGFTCYGGVDSPYVFWKIQGGNSWKFFDFLLEELHLITIPGRGFGSFGEGFIRVSSFISEDTLNKTCTRLKKFEDLLCATK